MNFIIFQIAKVNKKPALLGQLVLEESTTSDSRGRIQDLFTSNRMRLTLQVCNFNKIPFFNHTKVPIYYLKCG